MNIRDFINFTEKCPICNNDLKLYMSWMSGLLFKAEIIPKSIFDEATHKFNPIICDDKTLMNDYCLVGNEGQIGFATSNLIKRILNNQVFLFQICNEEGIKENDSHDDYHIKMPTACYYRSTPFMTLHVSSEHKSYLVEVWENHKPIIVKNETFTFSKASKEVNHYYALNMDYTVKESTIWYYSISDEQRNIPNFKPNKFEKILPLLNTRPKFDSENREKLISRFDSWILVS